MKKLRYIALVSALVVALPIYSAYGEASDMFSDRDLDFTYDESKSAVIQLNGSDAVCESDAVSISGGVITITDEGTYILTGTLDEGMIVVEAGDKDKPQLVLSNARIHSDSSAPIYVKNADKVFITTAQGTTNALSNGGVFTPVDDSSIDAVIFSKEDLTLNGSGTLSITSPAGHGVVSKDSLRLTGGAYSISCASHALSGKDDVRIANADLSIAAGKDGIQADNADDAALGFVYIESGNITIAAEGDGISASAYVRIEGGTFDIIAGGGSGNAAQRASDKWGGFMGGGRQPGGKTGGRNKEGKDRQAPPDMPADSQIQAPPEAPPDVPADSQIQAPPEAPSDATSDGTSMKGIKAAGELIIGGGAFTMNTADDALHSNTLLTVNGGTFDIASGDDALHADDRLTVTDGAINITQSYEGLEGLHIEISGGDIRLVASDDGLNAAGGTDSSGMTGGRDGMFGRGRSSSSNGSITITGGVLNITAYGDGIDANGSVDITGGNITICGPNRGDTATLDYDTSATISGGTFIGTGASGMAQTFRDSAQGVIFASVGNRSAGTQIRLTDGSGRLVIEHTPAPEFSVVILSSPDIVKGETYTLAVGDITEQVTAD